ncbi:MAG: hypothetical protein ACOH13_08125 [Flavobacteriales bacterium]
MRRLLLLFTVCISLSVCGQDTSGIHGYEADFITAANHDLTENELNEFYAKYDNLIFPHQGTTQLMNSLKGIYTLYSPLSIFKYNSAYKNNIERLLNSSNSMQRILAYITIGSAADTSYDNVLLERLSTETNQGCLTWAAMCLFYNHSMATDQLLDFLAKHEDFNDAHFVNLYLQLDSTNLKMTSWKNIDSDNRNAQIISLQTLAHIDNSSKTDSVIIHAIKTWSNEYKGYAIAALLQRDSLIKFDILSPYLDNDTTRNISIQVLEESKFQSDKDKIGNLKRK